MHGFTHVYDQETNKKDFFGYGGRSEFFGHDYQTQLGRITKGLEKLKRVKVKIISVLFVKYVASALVDFVRYVILKL